MFRKLINRLGRLFDRERETGDSFLVENTGRYRSANPVYWSVRLRQSGDSDMTFDYLFTSNEWKQAHDRALKNPEDVPARPHFVAARGRARRFHE